MACPQIVNGGEGLQIWRAAESILNKQLQTAEETWSSSLGPDQGANYSLTQEPTVHKSKACMTQTWPAGKEEASNDPSSEL
jgi:hypothetical protein